jgi:hypothetical protein
VCGGLIGGAKGGNRFCIKLLKDGGPSYCGVGSHGQKKAELVEGSGYIPSNGDRSNTRSAFFLAPIVDTRSLHQEVAAAILFKASRAVSFACTPATKRPRLTNIVSRSVGGGVNLGTRFKAEGFADKADSFVEELEVALSEDWMEDDDAASSSAGFSPSISQWNMLVKKVGSLTQELDGTRRALSQLAEGSDLHLEGLDDQVTNLRASVGRRPTVPGPDVPSMEMWQSVTGLSQIIQEVRHSSIDNFCG